MMNIYDWQKCLWRYIKEELYTPQRPLYLSFHPLILEEIFQNTESKLENLECNAIESFNKECNQHVIPSFNHIFLDERIWECDEEGLSLAICYAVQQILAVEDMQSQTFYEPYIKMMGAAEHLLTENLHKNPLGRNFEKIWKTVNSELLIVLACEQNQITFKQGVGTNKLRNYPFSQSLLSEVELSNLSYSFPMRKSKTEDNAKRFILRNERLLKKRSRMKLFNHKFMNRISQQLISYLSNYSSERTNSNVLTSMQKHVEEVNSTVEILCVSEGFGPDSYEMISRGHGSEIQLVSTYQQIEKCFANGFSLFLSNSAGRWISSSILGKRVSDLRSIIIGVDQRSSLKLVDVLGSELGVESHRLDLNVRINDSEVVGFYEFSVYGIDVKEDSLEKIFSNGVNRVSSEGSAKLEFEGGLVVDGRKKKYLINYPPTKLKYLDSNLSRNEMVKVNEKCMTVEELYSVFSKTHEECNFHICYRNSCITIGFEKNKFNLKMDVPVNQVVGNGLILSKINLERTKSDPYFSHFNIVNYRFNKRSQFESSKLMIYSHVPMDRWIALPEEAQIIDVFTEPLKESECSCWTKTFFRKIILSKRIPYPLLLEVENYKRNLTVTYWPMADE